MYMPLVRYMLSSVRLSSVVCHLSVTFVRPAQAIEIFKFRFTVVIVFCCFRSIVKHCVAYVCAIIYVQVYCTL